MGRKQGDSVVGVYMLHNQETGEAYIGSGILNKRRNAHFTQLRNGSHHNHKFQQAFDRNSNFDFIGVPTEGETQEEARLEALRIEAVLVAEHASDPLLLNLMRNITEDNTCLGHGPETVEAMRAETAKRWQDPTWREQVIAAQNAGRAAMTEEQKAELGVKRSELLKQAYADGTRTSTKGQARGEDFKQQTSERIASKWQDPEYRASQMASRPKGVRRDNGLSKAVEVDGVVYPTKTAAAQAFGITKQSVGHRLSSDRFPNWQGV